MLIVACPCALVVSTPVTVVSAMTALTRRGVLVKGGAFLDALAGIKIFALDKTGTLTQGQPRVTETYTLDCPPEVQEGTEKLVPCDACDEMLALASSVERRSEHPLARAILSEAEQREVRHRYPAAEAVQVLAGQGIEGVLNEAKVTVGNHALFHERQADCMLHERVQSAEADGQTVMLVGKEDRVLGYVGVADVPRESSRDALRALKEIDPQARIVMLTGDTPPVARTIAGEIGTIDEVRAGLLPDDKLQAIQSLQQHGPVAMIGDGINDAPALAAANVGIANQPPDTAHHSAEHPL
jgi:Cd2+/Zn2+-exporting ATPase